MVPPCCHEASALQSGRTCATHDRWTSHPEPVPRWILRQAATAWCVNSNPFDPCISRATHDVVLKVAREGQSLGAKCRRIEDNNRISLYETKGCESMNMEIAQHKTRQPKHKQQANRTILSLRRFCVTSLLPLMTCTSAMKVPRLTSRARRKTLPAMV